MHRVMEYGLWNIQPRNVNRFLQACLDPIPDMRSGFSNFKSESGFCQLGLI